MTVIFDQEHNKIYIRTLDFDEFGERVVTDRQISPERAMVMAADLIFAAKSLKKKKNMEPPHDS